MIGTCGECEYWDRVDNVTGKGACYGAPPTVLPSERAGVASMTRRPEVMEGERACAVFKITVAAQTARLERDKEEQLGIRESAQRNLDARDICPACVKLPLGQVCKTCGQVKQVTVKHWKTTR